MSPAFSTTRFWPAAALLAVLGLTWLAYAPGLAGGFLFDDFANLPNLGAFGPVASWDVFWRYLTSGSADVTGRPVALLSFLLDARDWPADPAPFKRSNLLLHLGNGVLLAFLLHKLGRYVAPLTGGASTGPGATRPWAAVLASALWLLHPLLVSTTLYVVQREAMLPATFVLLGLIGFVIGRERVAAGKPYGIACIAISLIAGTALGTLSKANGALLPLLALVVEKLLLVRIALPAAPAATAYRRVRWIVLVAPAVAVALGLVGMAYIGFANGMPAYRPWTLGQRLLTETRIVSDYLGMLWLPRPYSIGLFNDAIPVSIGWLSPLSTILSFLFLLGLAALAVVCRRRHAALALAIAFFFVGHLMESTVVPLELYFEHRNYLPAMLMFWPLTLWLTDTQPAVKAIRYGLAVLLPLGLASLTYMGSSLWGNEHDQAILWARQTPASPRAQAYAAQVEIERGQTPLAVLRLQRALAEHPDEIQVALNLIGAKCVLGTLEDTDIQRTANALRTTRNVGRLGFEWFERGFQMAKAKTCRGIDLDVVKQMLSAAEENTASMAVPGRRQDVMHLRGRIALIQGDPSAAVAAFDAAFDADPRPDAGLQQAAILGSSGYPEEALHHLDHVERVWELHYTRGWSMPALHEWLLNRQGYWPNEIAHLRNTLREDVAEKAAKARAPSAG